MVEPKVLTGAERDLIRGVFQWARANDWSAPHGGAVYQAPDGRQVDWWTYEATVLVLAPGVRRRKVAAVEVTSVQQAVDVLVALGLLPAGFSSMYRTGRADAYADTAGVHRRMPVLSAAPRGERR